MNNKLNLCLSGRIFELSYTENSLSLEEFFAVAEKNNFQSVELRDSQIDINSNNQIIDKVNILSTKYGIGVELITARKGRLDSDEGYEIYRKYLELATKINCKQIKVSGNNVSLIQKAASDAEKFNIKIGTNNHIGTPLATIKGTLEWFKKIEHSNYYLHFDPSHLWLNGEANIIEFIDEVFEKISYTIIQDYRERKTGSLCGTKHVIPVTIGENGDVGYHQIIKKLVSKNFKETFSIVYLENVTNLNSDKIKNHIIKYI